MKILNSSGTTVVHLMPLAFRLVMFSIIALTVISSSHLLILNNSLLAYRSSPSSSTDPSDLAAPSTISQGNEDFTAQAPLQIPRTLQSTDIVNSFAFYEVTFITSTTGAIDKIRINFPPGTNIAGAGVIERVGIGGGTLLKSGSSITYDVTNPVSIPAGTFIRLEFFGIKNPDNPGTDFHSADITTRESDGNLIDGPTDTNVYAIKHIGTDDIDDNSITSTKPAESFMKRVTVFDDTAGNAVGWNPNGVSTFFEVEEPAAGNSESTFVTASTNSASNDCRVPFAGNTVIQVSCDNPLQDGAVLRYVVENLPAHVVQ